MKNTVIFICVVFFTTSLFAGGAAFADARDSNGNAITWTFFVDDHLSPSACAKKAKAMLKKDGHKKVYSQAQTRLTHGHFAVVFSAYWVKDRLRKRYGFGFSKTSVEDAKAKAVKNLIKFAKGWKKSEGYTVNKTGEF